MCFRVLIHVVSEVHTVGKPRSLDTYVEVSETATEQVQVDIECLKLVT